MADCGAGGLALDRASRSLLAHGAEGGGDKTIGRVAGNLLGHASAAQTTASSMPVAALVDLALPSTAATVPMMTSHVSQVSQHGPLAEHLHFAPNRALAANSTFLAVRLWQAEDRHCKINKLNANNSALALGNKKSTIECKI